MQLLPLSTPLLQAGDDFAAIIAANDQLETDDIIAISAKALAAVEGAQIQLDTLEISAEAQHWSETLQRKEPDPAFRQAVLNETVRMNGVVRDDYDHIMLTELQPAGLETGVILAINAGLDRSNTAPRTAIGWPHDPVQSLRQLRTDITSATGKQVGLLLTDSNCQPRRLGLVATGLVAVGFEPITSAIGTPDLFGQPLTMTYEATADQLATAANFLMGNAAEQIPAVIIRDHGLPPSDFANWVPGIDPETDVFRRFI